MLAPPHKFDIVSVKSKRVVLDFQLAALFDITNRELRQTVRRHAMRFDEEAMITLGKPEVHILVDLKLIPNKRVLCGTAPYAFTALGVAQLSAVLRTPIARQVNKTIILTYLNVFPQLNHDTVLKKTKAKVERITHVYFNGPYNVIRKMLSEQVSYHISRKSNKKEIEDYTTW